MKISELQEKLEQLKQKHGDLNYYVEFKEEKGIMITEGIRQCEAEFFSHYGKAFMTGIILA